MVCYSYLNQTKPKANLAAHALYQFSIRENHLISERERDRDRDRDRECLCLWQPKSIMAFIKPFEVPQEM